MRRLCFLILLSITSAVSFSQPVIEDIMELNFTRTSSGGEDGFYGIGMAVHDFDQELYNTRFGYEVFLLSDLTASLMDGNYDRLKWGYPLLSHGLVGDADLRMNVLQLGSGTISAGVAVSSYYLGGSGGDNGNYITAGLSTGADFVLDNDLGIFTNYKLNFPFYAKGPYSADKEDGPVFSQFQAIVKYSFFSLDYDLLTAGGTTRSNIRIGVWSDMDWILE